MVSLLENTYFIIFIAVMFIFVGLPLVILVVFLNKIQRQFDRYEQELNKITSYESKWE